MHGLINAIDYEPQQGQVPLHRLANLKAYLFYIHVHEVYIVGTHFDVNKVHVLT